MTRLLGWIAIVWALLAFVFVCASPWIIRQKCKYKFGDFLNNEGISEIAEAEIRATRPSLVVIAAHQAVCLVAGIGLLRRRPWSRPMWLTLCWIGLGLAIFGAIWHGVLDLAALLAVALRGILLVWSIRILSSPAVRQEFAPSNCG